MFKKIRSLKESAEFQMCEAMFGLVELTLKMQILWLGFTTLCFIFNHTYRVPTWGFILQRILVTLLQCIHGLCMLAPRVSTFLPLHANACSYQSFTHVFGDTVCLCAIYLLSTTKIGFRYFTINPIISSNFYNIKMITKLYKQERPEILDMVFR